MTHEVEAYLIRLANEVKARRFHRPFSLDVFKGLSELIESEIEYVPSPGESPDSERFSLLICSELVKFRGLSSTGEDDPEFPDHLFQLLVEADSTDAMINFWAGLESYVRLNIARN